MMIASVVLQDLIVPAVSLTVGFVVGIIVGKNNKATVAAAVKEVTAAAKTVQTTVAADVKKL